MKTHVHLQLVFTTDVDSSLSYTHRPKKHIL